MKKLGILVFAAVILLCTYCPKDFCDLTAYTNGNYEFYALSSQNADFDNGVYAVIKATGSEQAKRVRASASGLKGECVRFNGKPEDVEIARKKLNLRVIKSQQMGDVYTVYGYSPLLARSVSMEGEKINVQIAYSKGRISIGTPLILGSY